MTENPSALIQPWLQTGERLLWSGRPRQGMVLSGKDCFLIPFSLVWGGFAIFWNLMVWVQPHGTTDEGEWFMRLWGLPFLLVGLYLIVGRFLHDAHLRRRLVYAVTDRRIIILRGRRLTSLDRDRLPRLDLDEHGDGSGTLSFEAASFSWGGMNGFDAWLPGASRSAQFFRIADPRRIYALLRDHPAA